MEPVAHGFSTTLPTAVNMLVPGGQPGPEERLIRGAQIGRYIVLDQAGSGGMGIVYSAYDRELGRKVALKFVVQDVVTSAARRDQLLREAQAMARLSHPNICAIHDIGTFRSQWFFAMELVDGETLRAWLRRPHGWRQVLGVLIDIGRGIAAAHAVGVVHGDIKPENVMIAADGRARVMDFGIARAEPMSDEADATIVAGIVERTDELGFEDSRESSKVRGTPLYMAPEQWRTRATDRATDQFSFCVMAWEALLGQRPFADDAVASTDDVRQLRPRVPAATRVPSWLQRTLQRGLAGRPADRFAGMDALVDALASGQGRRRRAIGVAAAAVLALGLGGAAGGAAWQEQQRMAACAADGASFAAEAWTAEARRGAIERMGAWQLAEAGAVAERTAARLDVFAERWQEVRTAACLGGDERRMACLDDQRARVELLVAALPVETRPAASASIRALTASPDPRDCEDPAALLRPQAPNSASVEEVALRQDLRRADVYAATDRLMEARVLIHSAVARADEAALTGLANEATMMAGRFAKQAGEFGLAEHLLRHALIEAGAAGLDEVAADAAIELTNVLGTGLARHAEGLRLGEVAEMLVRRLGQTDRSRYARLLTEQAGIRARAGELRGALALAERAEQILRRELGGAHPDLIVALDLLASLHSQLGQYARSAELYGSAIALAESLLGPDSVAVALSLSNLGTLHSFRMEHAQALVLQRRAVGIFERVLGPQHVDVARARENLANALASSGELEAALAEHALALAGFEAAAGPMHRDLAPMLHDAAYAHVLSGDAATGERLLRRAVTIWEAALAPNDPRLGSLLHALGETLLGRGAEAEGLATLERAARVLAASPQPERAADAQSALARAVWAVRGDRDEALAIAERAAVTYRASGPIRAAFLADLEAWMRTVETATPPRAASRGSGHH